VPAYEQIRAQIESMVQSGLLEAHTPLPAIRQLARDLEVAPGTVVKAFHELELAGTIVTQGRRGSRVAARSTMSQSQRLAAARAAAQTFVDTTRQLGLEPHEALSLLNPEPVAGLPQRDQPPDTRHPRAHQRQINPAQR
jgi:DNA-binding transcriptional regulator YhcF (GntR family)